MTNSAHAAALNFSGVAMVGKPGIDKIAAYVVLSMHNKAPLSTIEYHTHNTCSAQQFAQWDQNGIYPIDLGERKYDLSGFASATEWLVKNLGLPLSMGEHKVLELVNKNNENGFLKSLDSAVPFLLREFFELNVTDANWPVTVISAAADVVSAWINVQNGFVTRTGFEPVDEELALLFQEFTLNSDKPFTVGRYARDLWLLGDSSADIQAKVAFWREGKQKLESERARAEAAFKAMTRPDTFEVDGMTGIALFTSDHFLFKAVSRSRDYKVRLLVTDDGHVTVSTRNINLERLHEELCREEPGQWHYKSHMGAVINGGPQYVGVKPTALKPRDIIKLIQRNVRAPEKKG